MVGKGDDGEFVAGKGLDPCFQEGDGGENDEGADDEDCQAVIGSGKHSERQIGDVNAFHSDAQVDAGKTQGYGDERKTPCPTPFLRSLLVLSGAGGGVEVAVVAGSGGCTGDTPGALLGPIFGNVAVMEAFKYLPK